VRRGETREQALDKSAGDSDYFESKFAEIENPEHAEVIELSI
jgi:hypothetical protein